MLQVRFLLDAGADQEHKTDEMHTALMEASMDGHVEVARLLLDSGAQVNMPADSFESPLTLAACGGTYNICREKLCVGGFLEMVLDTRSGIIILFTLYRTRGISHAAARTWCKHRRS